MWSRWLRQPIHWGALYEEGGRGALVTHNDQLRAAVKDWAAKPGPMVIDVRISRTVPSIPYRRIHYGRDE